MDAAARVGRIEAVMHRDVGRRIDPLFAATRGSLLAAARTLADGAAESGIGLMTGFYVPTATPPAAETDGPAGAALLARLFQEVGRPCRVLTDAPNHAAVRVALNAAGAGDTALDIVAVTEPLGTLTAAWRAAGIADVIAIERCGPSAGGPPRNMRGEDISRHAAPLDQVFSAGPWRTIAIGDGGNEIGMGMLPRELITAHVAHGETIACVTKADHLLVAGVSHWGAYALIAALATVRPEWHGAAYRCLDVTVDRAVIEAMVRDGPAVDGVTQRRAATIDGIDLDTHHMVLTQILALCC